MYEFLNIFFFIFHTVFTLFNLIGWAFKKTRKLHLLTMLLTAGSWFILGIWYGWGFCFCTEWHWEVRAHLGNHDMPQSYITFLIAALFGIHLSDSLVETFTVIIFFCSLALSLILNWKDWRKARPLQ